jgi:hypothetical protein
VLVITLSVIALGAIAWLACAEYATALARRERERRRQQTQQACAISWPVFGQILHNMCNAINPDLRVSPYSIGGVEGFSIKHPSCASHRVEFTLRSRDRTEIWYEDYTKSANGTRQYERVTLTLPLAPTASAMLETLTSERGTIQRMISETFPVAA